MRHVSGLSLVLLLLCLVPAHAAVTPTIHANQTDDSLTVTPSIPVSISVSLDYQDTQEHSADWWALAEKSDGFYHFDLASQSWQPGVVATYQGPLMNLADYPIFDGLLEAGTETYYFGVDTVMNGVIDMDSAWYDYVQVLSRSFEPICRVDQPTPYMDAPYVGIHGNAGNNERIPCAGPETTPQKGWHSLQGYLIFNPITTSNDSIYAVVTRTSGCKLWRIDIESGKEFCLPKENVEALSFGVLGSSPELDEEENVYVTDGWGTTPDSMVSYTKSGDLRWRTSFAGIRQQEPDEYWPPLGLHFTPGGYATTVTPDGLVLLLDRQTGAVRAHFEILRETNLRPLPGADIFIPEALPQYLECRIKEVLGEDLSPQTLMQALSGGTGGTGKYTDNSIAVSGDLLFVVGGSTDAGDGLAEDGALVALRVTEEAQGPEISLAWYMETNGATGSSPTIDPAGKWAAISDTTAAGQARIVVADLQDCARAEGMNPPVCQPSWTYELEGSALIASLSMDENGVVYAWNQGPAEGQPMPTVLAVAPPDATHAEPYLLWGTLVRPQTLGRWTSSEWSSTALVLDDLIVGTVSHLNAATNLDLDLPLPLTLETEHELVGIDRQTGAIRWRSDQLPNDSINSPILGPDGNIYVPNLGMIDFAQVPSGRPPESCEEFVEDTFFGGVVQFLSEPD